MSNVRVYVYIMIEIGEPALNIVFWDRWPKYILGPLLLISNFGRGWLFLTGFRDYERQKAPKSRSDPQNESNMTIQTVKVTLQTLHFGSLRGK